MEVDPVLVASVPFTSFGFVATDPIPEEEEEEENEFEKIELTEAQQEMANAILELKKSFKEPVRKKGPLGQSKRIPKGPSVQLRADLQPQAANGPQGAYRYVLEKSL